MHDATVLVSEHLKFDVARPLDEFLQIQIGDAKGLLRLVASRCKRGGKFSLAAHDAHPASPASGRRFQDHRVLNSRGLRESCGFILHDSRRAGHHRHASGGHRAAGLIFFAHHAQQIGRGADEGDVRSLADLGEIRILGKKSVARMDCVDVGDFSRADHLRDVQVALARTSRPNAHGFIRKTHVQRVAVRLGIDCDRGDAQFLARIDHAQGNLTAISYKDFSKHLRPKIAQAPAGGIFLAMTNPHRLDRLPNNSRTYFRKLRILWHYFFFPVGRSANSGSPYSTGWPFSISTRTTSPPTSASISFMSFMASMMHTVCPASTKSPTRTNGPASGLDPA